MLDTQLADAHWIYIEALLQQELDEDILFPKADYIEKVGWHYKMAMIHGIKHGKEDN